LQFIFNNNNLFTPPRDRKSSLNEQTCRAKSDIKKHEVKKAVSTDLTYFSLKCKNRNESILISLIKYIWCIRYPFTQYLERRLRASPSTGASGEEKSIQEASMIWGCKRLNYPIGIL
jgi:hypothetical protein